MKKLNYVILLCIFILFMIGCSTKENEYLFDDMFCDKYDNLNNLMNRGYVVSNEEYVIYNAPDLSTINKIDKKGQFTRIYDGELAYLNINSEIIYGINSNDEIISMDINGKNVTHLCGMKCVYMYIYDNKIYMICSDNSENYVYKMDLDGTNIQKLSNIKNVSQIYLYNDKIFGLFNENYNNIYSFNLDGSYVKKYDIPDTEHVLKFWVYDNGIFLLDTESAIRKYDINLNTIDYVTDAKAICIPSNIAVSKNNLFFMEMKSVTINKFNMDTGELSSKKYKPNQGHMNIWFSLGDKLLSYEGEKISVIDFKNMKEYEFEEPH